ncbi:hypothetical protein HBI13_059480 [Parastagonospora nodorum]|nr:hypothetical protein HBI10_090460 [Parastagonospora nodorum]KAH4027463.1 hypothetical protein HBI13_059480 [Parastagonospora nodorum]KAH5260366.1 hypothetical protein HBI72_112280 [Parastagonospora nodorum]
MSSPLPTKIGIILFPGFQLLDAAGPLDAFSLLSQQHPLEISILGATISPISTAHAMQSSGACIVPTHTFAQARELGLDVLVLPGGLGTRTEENVREVVEFVKSLGPEGVRWMLTVCTGSEVLARTGWLDGRRATTNKRAFNEVKAKHPAVQWVPKARWVVDGNIWTSSGISAGIDLAFAWIANVFGVSTSVT